MFPFARPQGSLINQQKRKIANAVEWIRRYGKFKPLIFVATAPGYTHAATTTAAISTFCHNLRNGYHCEHYVWVRELTKKGFPHFHFVASLPFISDLPKFSLYWSSLLGSDSVNSIRLGTSPSGGHREFYVKSQSMAWYLSKYLGKGLSKENSYLCDAGFPATRYRKTYRQFDISQQVRLMSQPMTYDVNYNFEETTEMVCSMCGLVHCRCVGNYPKHKKPSKVIGKTFQDSMGNYFDPHSYEWTQHPEHKVWFGTKKTIKKQLELWKLSRVFPRLPGAN
jgi:hypothetical protein